MEEEHLNPIVGEHPRISLPQSSAVRDSVITYSTDIGGSSIGETRTNTFTSKQMTESSPRFYRQKRFWTICVAVTIVLLAIFIPLFILVIFPAIAQSAIDGSTLNLNSINLTDIQEDSVTIASSGNVTNAGPFSSTISFDEPVSMIYNGIEMARLNFDPISTNNGHADIILGARKLTIIDKDAFSNFSLDAFVQDSIKMTIKGSARVKSIGITRGSLNLHKEVTLKGASNFPNVSIASLNINQDPQNPNNLIIEHIAQLYNPSIFYINMGKYGANIVYNNTHIASMVITNFTLEPGMNNISMIGNAVMPNSLQDLANLGSVMQAYMTNNPITTQAQGVYVYPDGQNSVAWLTSVITKLPLNAVVGNNPRLEIITGLDLGNPTVNFNGQPDYAALFSATNVKARYKLPFNINTTVLQVKQDITLLTEDGQEFANHSTSIITVTNDNGTEIIIDIPPTPLTVISGNNNIYQTFFANLTKNDQGVVNIKGLVNIVANTTLGAIPINGIPFNVTTTLQGFSNFAKTAPTVNNVTILDATSSSMVLGIHATIHNPSNMSIMLGTTTFKILHNDAEIGVASTNLSVVPGANNVTLQSTMDPNNSPQATEILTNFMNKIDSLVIVAGYDGSTTTGIVDMSNPFVAGLNIIAIESTITADDFQLAKVSQSNLNINIPGGKTITTDLPISLNLDPPTLFGLLRQEAKTKKLNTDVIDTLISIGNINVPGVPHIDPSKINPDIFDNFDIIKFTKSAMGSISTNMSNVATVVIVGKSGSYQLNSLPMTQLVTNNVDDSIKILIRHLSVPIATSIVAASTTTFTSVKIQNPGESEFTSIISGEIEATVPLSAQIATPNGFSVTFNDKKLGNVNFPSLKLVRGKGKLKSLKSQFKIEDKDALADFTQQFLNVDTVSWLITSPSITVTAMKLDIPGVPFNQNIQLKGANGFKNAIKINKFELPGDAHEGGISTTIDATLSNSGTIGIELGTALFDVFSDTTKIGEVSTDGFVLQPNGDSSLKLKGRLIPQSGDGLQVIQKIFNEFLAEQEIPLSTKGTGIKPSINWIEPAFKSLKIDSVLPAQHNPPLISGINLDKLSLTFTPDTAYNPDSSSDKITAEVQTSFGFSLDITDVAQKVVIINDGANMAELDLAKTPTSSKIKDGKGTVDISYKHIPLQVFGDAHSNFDSYVKDLTIKDSLKFGFVGSTDAFVKTPVGEVTLSNISVNVISKLDGFQGFNSKKSPAKLIDVTNGTEDTLTIPISTSIFNPTGNTISVGDVNFGFSFEKQVLGTALIQKLTLVPGINNVTSIVTFKPTTDAAKVAGLKMFSSFVSNKTVSTVIFGSEKSTEVDSLKKAFSAISIQKELPPLPRPLIKSMFVSLTDTTPQTKLASGGFFFDNQFTTDISMTGVQNGVVKFHNILLGLINITSPFPIVFPGKNVTQSQPPLPITLNLNPKDLINIIKLAAKDAEPDKKPKPPKGNITDLILEVLNSMKVDLTVERADSSIGKFKAPLAMEVKKVPVAFDSSALILMSVVAPQVAQRIIDH
ncbi:28606_t:CDS:2, partial [Racocetra persica]